jgi:hypothetical protein
MNCKQFQEQAIEIAFGESDRTGEFDRHLGSCDACREEFAAYAFAAKGIEDAPAPPPPSLSNERLYSAIRAQNIRPRGNWLPRLAFAGAVASVALAAWIGFNRPMTNARQPYIASVNEDQNKVPTGPIVIPEPIPEVESAAPIESNEPAPESLRTATKTQPRKRVAAPRVVEEIPEELLAVVIGGAEGALDFEPASSALSRGGAMMEPAPEVGPAASASPIVVIQPQGQATEKSSDDVSIGG